ncbi:hypothetical protein DL771_002532 [Monosporascus sp. 5C6A]|nr:hypothetical protein DL771_002532 [Monosporascus sp. 5C6A]
MSHIPIAPSKGRATFDALPQTHSSDVGYLGEYGQGRYRDEGESFAHGYDQQQHRDEDGGFVREYDQGQHRDEEAGLAYGYDQGRYRGAEESFAHRYDAQQHRDEEAGLGQRYDQGQYRSAEESFAHRYDEQQHRDEEAGLAYGYDQGRYRGAEEGFAQRYDEQQHRDEEAGLGQRYDQGQYRGVEESFAHGYDQRQHRDEEAGLAHGYDQGQYRGVEEGFTQRYGQGQYRGAEDSFTHGYDEQQYRDEGEGFTHGYDRDSHQVPYDDLSSLYDGRGYAGVAQFESGDAPSSDHAPHRQQSHSIAAQPPQPMYHQCGSSNTCAGAPLPNQLRPNYKPSALRWPFLSLLFVTLVAFVGLLVYAMYALPQRDILPKLINSTSKPDTVRRHIGDAIETIDGTAKPPSPGAPEERDYSEVSGIMATHSVTIMQAHRSGHDDSVGRRTDSVSVSAQTTPEVVATGSMDNSGGVSTTDPPVITTTVPSGSYGDITVTVTRPQSDFGDISVTVTFPPKESNSAPVSTQTTPETLPTRATDDDGDIFTTGPPVIVTTVPSGSYGDISVTVTEPTYQSTRPESDFGDISVTVTFPPKESNSVPVSTQTTPQTFQTRPIDDYGDISSTYPSIASSRPRDSFGDISVTVTFPPKESNSVPVSTQTTLETFPSRPIDDYGDISRTDPPDTATRPPDDFGDVPVTETFPPAETRLPDDSGRVDPLITTVTIDPTDRGDVEVVQTLVLTPTLVVETDANGIPTATLTDYPSFTRVIPTSHITVLTNSLGEPTGTVVTDALLTPSITVETDSNGIPTATRTSYGIIPTKKPEPPVVRVLQITYGKYFIGMFLPTILAMAISIPIRILDLNVKLLQPWHELTKPGGASGRRSLCLETGGLWGLINAVRWVFGGQVLIVLTTSLVLASMLLVPLSAEAIAFDLQGSCVKGSGKGKGCLYVVSVFREAAGGTLALLGLMAMMVFTILVYLVKWQSGVGTNPWSICGIASLSLNENVRKLFPSHAEGGATGQAPDELMKSLLEDRFFTLGYFNNSEGGLEYGIMLQENDVVGPHLKGVRDEDTPSLDEPHWYKGPTHTGKKHHQPFPMVKYSGRVLLLILLCGILALILYYNNTGGETAFEHFMMSESFGVRFLFTGVGFLITLCWSSFFNSVAVLSPYYLLAQAPQSAQRSILLAPPTNAFSGVWSAVRRRDGFLAVVALTSVLSEFLPVVLAEIPFRVSQTYLVHRITTWSAVGILCIMLLVLVSSFFIKWPHMPLDPTTVAGAMYYVADSWMLGGFDGLGTLGPKDRDRRVVSLGLKYRFGQMTGVSGETRVGVDITGDPSSVAGW